MLLAVNYHYVGMPAFPYPGIWGLSVNNFLEQLFWLKGHFDLIGIPELTEAIAKKIGGGDTSKGVYNNL